jgi:hypothetical protein
VRPVTERVLKGLLEEHVELFNAAVSSGDYRPFLAMFADHAVMRFDDFPLGPFVGRREIAEAWTIRPASDTMALIDMRIVSSDAVYAAFEWDAAGGTGEIFLRFDSGKVIELVLSFGEVCEPYAA